MNKNRKYTINSDFFEEINTEAKAYCLGFLCADGYLSTGNRGISIALSEQDSSFLYYLKNSIDSNAPISIKKPNPKYFKRTEQFVLGLHSKKLCNDLISLGFQDMKKGNIGIPNISTEFHRHFLRGLMDGDGSIGTHQFWLVGSEPVLKDFQNIAKNIGADLKIGQSNKYPRLYGGRKAKSFLQWIYDDHAFCLSRKYDRFIKSW
jgi:DNA-binding transcriptional regulator WhiA